jgi:predicted Fe-Mo cluster-binding NifX family protein
MALAREMDVPFLGQIPVDPEVVMAGDAGLSLLRVGPLSPAAKAFSAVVDAILGTGEQRHSAKTEDDAELKSRLKIVVPVAAGELSPRFGACDELALFEVDRRTNQILGKSFHPAPPHFAGVLPRRLRELDTDVVLAAEMGQQARHLLAKQGVEVVLDVQPKPLDKLVLEYLNKGAARCATSVVR